MLQPIIFTCFFADVCCFRVFAFFTDIQVPKNDKQNPATLKQQRSKCHPRQCKIRWQISSDKLDAAWSFSQTFWLVVMLFLLAEGILLRGLWTYYLTGSTPKMDGSHVSGWKWSLVTTGIWMVGLLQIFRGRIQLTYIEAKIHLLSTRRTCH